MKVLVTGVKGQLGYDVVRELQNADMRQSAWISTRWILPMRQP